MEENHFEKLGEPILKGVMAQVTQIVLFRQLDPHVPALPKLAYVLFGKGEERFLAHVITKYRSS